ncbi:MAG: DNA primase [Actinomycetota bacterium]
MSDRGRIKAEDLETLREKASIVDVASDHMVVRRVGRRFVARCPFHDEKTPSFSMDPASNLFYCFGCGEGGDVFTLIRRLDGLDFAEAAERLAGRFGVSLRYEEMSPQRRDELRKRARLYDAMGKAIAFYHGFLKKDSEANGARDYLLNQRGFDRSTIETFQVGYAPARSALVSHLRSEGVRDDDMVATNLAHRDDAGGLVDRFRGRVMFPIWDSKGEPIGFGARKMGEGPGPKYLNTSETPLYHKSHVLYALDKAKAEIVKEGQAILVEGYTDVLALHEAGIRAAVATCGTALGGEHLKAVRRFADTLIVCMDGDEAGGAAAERLFDQLGPSAQEAGLTLRVVAMPAGKDPAEVVRASGGSFGDLLAEAQPLVGFVLAREAGRYRRSDGHDKARALQAGLKHLVRVSDRVIQRDAARRFADLIGVDPAVVFVELDRLSRGGGMSRDTAETVIKRSSAQVRREANLLRLLAHERAAIEPLLDQVDPMGLFSVSEHAEAWKAIFEGVDPSSITDEAVRKIVLAAKVDTFDETDWVPERFATETVARLRAAALGRQIERARAELERMNPETERAAYDAAFAQLLKLETERRSLQMAGEDIGSQDA